MELPIPPDHIWTVLPICPTARCPYHSSVLSSDAITVDAGLTVGNDQEEGAMYVMREVLHCRPGKVRPMVEKFRAVSAAFERKGQEPLRLLTDVSGELFWTLIVEAQAERIEEFFTLERELMQDESLRDVFADLHSHIEYGRR
jgi:hypothetical protein